MMVYHLRVIFEYSDGHPGSFRAPPGGHRGGFAGAGRVAKGMLLFHEKYLTKLLGYYRFVVYPPAENYVNLLY